VFSTIVRRLASGRPGGFKDFFPTIEERNLTAADVPEIAAAAEEAGMQVSGPPLSDEEVEMLKAGKPLYQSPEPATSAR
jgi:hypothetical protein